MCAAHSIGTGFTCFQIHVLVSGETSRERIQKSRRRGRGDFVSVSMDDAGDELPMRRQSRQRQSHEIDPKFLRELCFVIPERAGKLLYYLAGGSDGEGYMCKEGDERHVNLGVLVKHLPAEIPEAELTGWEAIGAEWREREFTSGVSDDVDMA